MKDSVTCHGLSQTSTTVFGKHIRKKPTSCSSPSLLLTACAVGTALLAPAGHVQADDGIQPFTEEAIARGLIYEMRLVNGGKLQSGYGHGIAIADLNGNGHNDIILTGHPEGIVGFFENDGTGMFTDRSWNVTEGADPVPKFIVEHASGIAVADYNGNGLRDIFFTQFRKNSTGEYFPGVLLRNEGDFTFTDVTVEAGVTHVGNGEGAAWGDFDNDGWLDLYVVNFTLPSVVGDPQHHNRLYRNLGDGTFQNVAVEQGVDNHGLGFSVVFSDANRNGWLDIYIANDRGHLAGFPPNQFWVNNQGQYANACDTSGACLGLWAMCVGAGDFTGNGFPDFYVTNIAHPAGYNGWNPLLVNQGDHTFVEQCSAAGVCQFITSWAGIFFDYSNNGWLDLYVCNQWVANNLFANDGNFPATIVTQQAGVGGNSGQSYNAAIGDLTGNGALDIVLNNFSTSRESHNVQLFVNHEGTKRNWARFNVVGYAPNHYAIGSNIEVTAGEHTQWRELYAGGNNMKSQNELVYHFGLADATVMDQIVVNWPGGTATRTLTNYPANQTWTIYPQEVLGDANSDGVIDGADLLALLAGWGPVKPGNEKMDINGDGVIDGADLLGLLARWGPLN